MLFCLTMLTRSMQIITTLTHLSMMLHKYVLNLNFIILNICSHLNMWIAVTRHNFMWVKSEFDNSELKGLNSNYNYNISIKKTFSHLSVQKCLSFDAFSVKNTDKIQIGRIIIIKKHCQFNLITVSVYQKNHVV